MKIFHISDTHITDSPNFQQTSFAIAMNNYQNNNYDLFIHSGDVTNNGKRSEYEKAVILFKRHCWPDIIVPGNHDKRSGGIVLYRKYIGNANGVKVTKNALVIFVDSGIEDTDDGRIGIVKYNMIKEALNKYQKKEIKILVMHHHVVPVPMTGRERNVLTNAGDILDLIVHYDVDLVVSGHRHYPNVYKLENTIFVSAGTVSDSKTRYGDVNSFNSIDIDNKTINIEINRVNNTKNKKSFKRKGKHVYYNFGKKVCRIVQISNTFIANSSKFLKSHFLKAVKTINNSKADIVIHCGGIVQEGIERNYNIASHYLNKIKPPILFTPAGRDINYLGYELFQYYFGDFDRFYKKNSLVFQGISSSQYDSSIGIIGRTERENLFAKLEKYKNTFLCLFLHHNLLPIPHSREKGLLEDSGDLLRDIVDNNIDLVLTGTAYYPFAGKIDNTIVINANSVSSVYHRNIFGNSFNMIDVYKHIVVVYQINSLWGTKKFLGMWDRNRK